jgi:hypothetical protein
MKKERAQYPGGGKTESDWKEAAPGIIYYWPTCSHTQHNTTKLWLCVCAGTHQKLMATNLGTMKIVAVTSENERNSPSGCVNKLIYLCSNQSICRYGLPRLRHQLTKSNYLNSS